MRLASIAFVVIALSACGRSSPTAPLDHDGWETLTEPTVETTKTQRPTEILTEPTVIVGKSY